MSASDLKPEDLSSLPRLPLDADGPVFAEPWQAQAFAMAVQLHQQGAFTWTEWAAALSDELKGAEDDGSHYYEGPWRAWSPPAASPPRTPCTIRSTPGPTPIAARHMASR